MSKKKIPVEMQAAAQEFALQAMEVNHAMGCYDMCILTSFYVTIFGACGTDAPKEDLKEAAIKLQNLLLELADKAKKRPTSMGPERN